MRWISTFALSLVGSWVAASPSPVSAALTGVNCNDHGGWVDAPPGPFDGQAVHDPDHPNVCRDAASTAAEAAEDAAGAEACAAAGYSCNECPLNPEVYCSSGVEWKGTSNTRFYLDAQGNCHCEITENDDAQVRLVCNNDCPL